VQDFNVTGPKITATVMSQVFSFLVLSVVEQAPNMSIVDFVDVTNLEFDLVFDNTSSSQFWNFSKILDSGANIQIHITFFNSSANVTFGNETFYMAPSTFKLAVTVRDWPFRSTQNSMRVWFENSAGGTPLTSCNVDSNTNSDTNLRWLKLNVAGVSLYAQMVEFAMMDGIKRYITYETKNMSYAAVLPFFWEDMVLDPNYGFLVDANSECSQQEFVDSLRTRWEVYLAIPIFVVLAIGAVLLWKYFRIRDYIKKDRVHSVEIEIDEN